jgi:hypothetical protein
MNPDSIFRHPGNRKPAVRSGGLPDPFGSNHVKKDTTNMSAISLFNKTMEPSHMVRQWIERGRSERFVVEAQVCPAMASALLHRNADNRVARQAIVEDYAAAMRRGEWFVNGQNIIVAKNGDLNDGQHRLMAVIDADMVVTMGLQFGVERATRATLDVGRKRTLGDHLAMAGHINSNLLAATVRIAWCYDNGIWSMSQSPSVAQAMDYVAANPAVHEFLRAGVKIGKEFSSSGSNFAFATFVCSRVSYDHAIALADQVYDGLGLTASNLPAARVRERLIAHASKKALLKTHEPAAIFIKAFNATITGRRLRPLSWSPTGPSGESFPIAGA